MNYNLSKFLLQEYKKTGITFHVMFGLVIAVTYFNIRDRFFIPMYEKNEMNQTS